MPGEVAAAAPAAAGAGGDAAAGQQQRGPLQGMLGGVLRMMFMWWLMNWMKGGKVPPAKPGAEGVLSSPSHTYPLYQKGDLVDFYAFVSERPGFPNHDFDMAELVWSETGIRLAEPDTRKYSFVYEPSPVRAEAPKE